MPSHLRPVPPTGLFPRHRRLPYPAATTARKKSLPDGELRADLERPGTPVGNLDLMIAAHALAANAGLVTSDAALRQIKRLKTEDWTK